MNTDNTNTREAAVVLLASRFVERQGISGEDAARVAEKIAGADEDIWTAAIRWLESGSLPDEPKICGYTPESLGSKFSPSATLTALMALRREPERTLQALKFSPEDLHKPALEP